MAMGEDVPGGLAEVPHLICNLGRVSLATSLQMTPGMISKAKEKVLMITWRTRMIVQKRELRKKHQMICKVSRAPTLIYPLPLQLLLYHRLSHQVPVQFT